MHPTTSASFPLDGGGCRRCDKHNLLPAIRALVFAKRALFRVLRESSALRATCPDHARLCRDSRVSSYDTFPRRARLVIAHGVLPRDAREFFCPSAAEPSSPRQSNPSLRARFYPRQAQLPLQQRAVIFAIKRDYFRDEARLSSQPSVVFLATSNLSVLPVGGSARVNGPLRGNARLPRHAVAPPPGDVGSKSLW